MFKKSRLKPFNVSCNYYRMYRTAIRIILVVAIYSPMDILTALTPLDRTIDYAPLDSQLSRISYYPSFRSIKAIPGRHFGDSTNKEKLSQRSEIGKIIYNP